MKSHVSISVMTVPIRAALLGRLLDTLDCEPWAVIEDFDREGPWPTARKAWLDYHPNATHVLVLQDDIAVAPNLRDGLERMLDNHEDEVIWHSPVSLFGISKKLRAAYEEGYSFACGNGISWGQALMLPAKIVPNFIAWCDHSVRPNYKHDDARLSLFCLNMGWPVYTTLPCLVDHLDVPSECGNPRLAGGRHERRAAVFTGESALEINWKMPARTLRQHSLAAYKDWEVVRHEQ